MKFKDIKEILNANILTDNFNEDLEVNYAFASDLMSDVLAYANNDTLLITGLNNPQVIRTAEMMDISIVVLVRGKLPSKETIDLANENLLTIFSTDYIMFKACGLLFEKGMKGLE
ncbi:MAG: DRTGG domain-containing protein [Tissierellia bacterium]|nr:DRTGG domain-containing protein [Tissierellia bacterium]